MSPRLGVVSDDLSGGVAVGGELSSRGLRTLVTAADGPGEWTHDAVVLDTASRYFPAEQAAAATRMAFRRLRTTGAEFFCKKVDSMFRGHPGVEIAAARTVLDAPLCLVVPPSPRYGRVTVHGHQLVLGDQPLYVNLLKLLAEQAGEEVGLLPLDAVFQGAEAVAAAVANLALRYRLVVSDAVNQAQINLVVQAAAAAGVRLFAGTYGLGEALARASGSHLVTPRNEPQGSLSGSPVVVMAGSYSPVTRRQVQRAEAAGMAVVDLDCTDAVTGGDWQSGASRAAAALAGALASGQDAVLYTASRESDVARIQALGQAAGLDESAMAGRIRAVLAAVFEAALEGRPVSGLVLTGGETARSLYDAWGAVALELGPELIPASPLCRIVGGRRSGLAFVTKAGAYGDPDALISLVRDLKVAARATRKED